MNNKGIESMPYTILISMMIVLFAVALFGTQMDDMATFRTQKDFYNSLSNMIEKMSIMKSSSDYGSINRIELVIPTGYSVVFNENSTISIRKENQAIDEISLKTKYINITELNEISILNSGNHEIILQYGEPVESANHSITFK